MKNSQFETAADITQDLGTLGLSSQSQYDDDEDFMMVRDGQSIMGWSQYEDHSGNKGASFFADEGDEEGNHYDGAGAIIIEDESDDDCTLSAVDSQSTSQSDDMF
ncbi:hypothetical protein MBANPS3_012524, partial [Mucor bainieri]